MNVLYVAEKIEQCFIMSVDIPNESCDSCFSHNSIFHNVQQCVTRPHTNPNVVIDPRSATGSLSKLSFPKGRSGRPVVGNHSLLQSNQRPRWDTA